MDNYTAECVDLSNTKFNKLVITEQEFNGELEYHGNVDVDIKYTENATDDKPLNRILRDTTLKYKKTILNTVSERPEILKDVVTKEDIKEDTVDGAIEDFINQNMNKPGLLLNLVFEVFGIDIPKFTLESAYNSRTMIINNGRVKELEFDYRKPEVKSIWVKYENDASYTVELPKPVTNSNCDAVVPDMTLAEMYVDFEDWLEEDYQGTIEIANEIFGINLETLEGGQVK